MTLESGEVITGLRICTKCNKGKPPEDFYLHRQQGPNRRRPECKDCTKAQKSANRKPMGHRPRQASRYGLSVAEAEVLWNTDRCEICGSTDPQSRHGVFYIDHDHSSGVVRGALCASCNMGLGYFKDNPEVLRAAAGYLERRPGE